MPYKDSLGFWTVGYGHNLTVPLTERAMTQILMDDIAFATAVCHSLAYWPTLSLVRRNAVINMVFNLGFPGFMKFKNMNAAMLVGDYERAAREMLDSTWANQVGDRAKRLAQQIRTDVMV